MIRRVVSMRFPDEAFDAHVGRRPVPKVKARIPSEKLFAQFGNPFTGADAIKRYEAHLKAHAELVEEARIVLADMTTLACWCAPKGGIDVDSKLRCHAQVLARAVRDD